jgi:hypothetical protein
MRQVLSLSLPEQVTKEIKISSKQRGFSSVSGYVKYLFELDRDLILEKELLSSIKEARKEYKNGKTVKAKSIADLL